MALTDEESARGLIEVEVWVAVDKEEQAWANTDRDNLVQMMVDDDADACRRLVKVTIKLPVPQEIEVAVELPEESSEATVKVV